MFRDLCAVTDVDTGFFLGACVVLGALIGLFLAYRTQRLLSDHAPKIGCLAMPMVAFSSGYGVKLLFPDPRDHGELCGHTPDVIFYPGYAFCVVPISMVIAFAVASLAFSKSNNP